MTLIESAAVLVALTGALAVTPDLAARLYADASTGHERITGHQADVMGQSYYSRHGYHAEACSDLVRAGYISTDDASSENCQIIEYRLRDLAARAALQEVW